MKKKLGLTLAAGLMCAAMLAGCGGSSSETEPQTIGEPTSAAEESAQETAAAEPTGAQELTFVLNNEPDSLDPSYTNNSFASPFLANLFEGLVTYDENGELAPGNAESWESNEDMTVWTFHLRDGLKWSDGTPLTAEDYVYSALHVMTPTTTSQYVNMMTDYIVNGQEYYDGAVSAEEVGVKALDENTVEYTLKQPTPFFADVTSMWVYSPVQEATVEANGDKWSTAADTYVSNGPFKVSEINMGESVVLAKNENYWDAENVTLEKLTFRYILDQSTALTAYENGEVDGVRNIPAGDIARLKAEGAGTNTINVYGTVYYNFNCEKEPYNNPLVRKALNLAIDREAIINNVAQLDAQPAYSILAPGYMVDGKDILEGRSTFEMSPNADVEAAQAALAEAGYPNGEGFPTVQLSFYSDDTVKKVAEAIQEMWETNLGINVEVTSADWAVFYSGVQNGDYEVAAMGWSADYVNPISFLPLLVTGDVTNTSFYSNPEYDALVEQIKVERDPAAFAQLVKEADELVSSDYPVLPLYYKADTYLLKDYVSGVYTDSSAHLYFKNAVVTK
ncbi:MAG TPA: peptide ABC transporter substrate-binding protein [Candidatus Lachnoclostridium stercorigallinarum]|uniref:Peptide ABC transporter substrate-binding protein n=1 Tax=Candidatus Lachnoclostridium stercorigallinarum TaxID=2838634 RepID=A0A9D2GHA8_9FIRM|nr:peptide ABC transporter substrate-binding protein [Candidatus Lachnoclostridium stercorigallinarum]